MRFFIKLESRIAMLVMLIAIFISSGEANAQLECSKWTFGDGAAIDFRTGEPVPFKGSKLRTNEGCATISDKDGNLMFYTDGVTVWNKYNDQMPNGVNLNGHFSSTQSVVIVPKPASKTIFYVFTLDWEADLKGFSYSIVDIEKEKGLGDVTIKNCPIKQFCTERVVAVKHRNNKDIWVIVHEYNSIAFYVYLLTSDGLNPNPVISNTGSMHRRSKYNTIGYMKLTLDKKKLGVAITGDRKVEVFDFDDKTGIVSNPRTVDFKKDASPYGLEFSPNNAYLYVGIGTTGYVYQVDVSKPTQVEMQESLRMIAKAPDQTLFGSLQLAIDGKIYITEYQSKYLSVIASPDKKNCDFKYRSLFLDGKVAMFGLPSFYHEHLKMYDFSKKPNYYTEDTRTELNTKYILGSVYFDFDETVYQEKSIPELVKLLDILTKNPKVKIELIGHTDSLGSDDYNNTLSMERADRIERYLINKGISNSRITTVGRGRRDPVSSNEDEKGRQDNRRVEFILKDGVAQ